MKIKYFTYVNMCSVSCRYKVPGKDLFKNTIKTKKEKKSVFTFRVKLTIEQIYDSLKT